jgi:hypothetical protein
MINAALVSRTSRSELIKTDTPVRENCGSPAVTRGALEVSTGTVEYAYAIY